MVDDLPIEEVSEYTEFYNTLVIQLLGNFQRRARRPTQEFPLSLLWLGYARSSERCPKRQSVCSKILGTADAELHVQAIKIKTLFYGEVQRGSETGAI
eukprot:1173929-Pyramimonas_sp.AAC.1